MESIIPEDNELSDVGDVEADVAGILLGNVRKG